MKFGIEFDTKLNIPYAEQARMMKEHGFDASFIGLEADNLGEIVDALHQYDIEIESCHAPFDGINNMWLAGEAGDRMYERLTNSIDACAEYKIPVVVVHLSSGMKSRRLILLNLFLNGIVLSNLLTVNNFLNSLAVFI